MPKTTKSESKLTPKQEKFVLNIIDGMSQRQAYIDAFGRKCETSAHENMIDRDASVLFNSPKVSQRYHQILEEQKDRFILTSTEKRKMLKQIIQDQNEKLDNRLKAMDMDNKMGGEYTEKLDIGMHLDTLGELTFIFGKN